MDSRLEQLEKDVRSLRTLPFREQQTVRQEDDILCCMSVCVFRMVLRCAT